MGGVRRIYFGTNSNSPASDIHNFTCPTHEAGALLQVWLSFSYKQDWPTETKRGQQCQSLQ